MKDFIQLIAAMNHCPCGYYGDEKISCRCTPDQISRYRNKLSGPLLDRIDLQLGVPRINPGLIVENNPQEECSATVRQRVLKAYTLQINRCGIRNAQLDPRQLEKVCTMTNASRTLLMKAVDQMVLSSRAMHKTLRVARTLADLENSETLKPAHISEALAYRNILRVGPVIS